MSGHTPGPWRTTKDGRIFSEGAKEWNRTFNTETPAWIAATGANPANARLIAAAPALLEALKAARYLLMTRASRNKDEQETLRTITDAIAAAEGRE